MKKNEIENRRFAPCARRVLLLKNLPKTTARGGLKDADNSI
jgi:hypothetical protein